MANPLDFFNIGFQASPLAGIGNAIKNVLAQDRALSLEAGKKGIELEALERQPFQRFETTFGEKRDGQKTFTEPIVTGGRIVGQKERPLTTSLSSELASIIAGRGGGGTMDRFGTLRQQAINALDKAGQPLTEANITQAIEDLQR